MKVKVANFTSPCSGREVANQFLISADNKEYFQSYNSVIAVKDWGTGETILDARYWDYSVTTGKYRNQFLGENKQETKKKIENGTYKLANLN